LGCGQPDFSQELKTRFDRGDPESPISQGNLCPTARHPINCSRMSRRETKMKYRAPRAKEWTSFLLIDALDMCGSRVESRKRTFVHSRRQNDQPPRQRSALWGGAHFDNERKIISSRNFSL